jgi:hypothetical protein
MRGLRLARQDELEEIFARYAAHAAWMREIGIHQWNDTDYLGCIRRTTMRICSGAGKAILREAEKLAKPHDMEVMRLDCADDNTRLNAWYEAQGYFPCGTCIRRTVQRNSPREAALKRVLRYSGQNGSQTLRVWLVTYSSIVGIEILSVPWASNSAM